MPHTLYLCYFGLNEPLVQTQVLPYLRELKKMDDLKISLLTFEPNFKKTWNAEEIENEKQSLAQQGIDWHALPYHKRPTVPATLYDILNGAIFSIRLARRGKIDILHARSHIPAMMAAIAKRVSGGKLLFDIRGFLPEEYTDAGVWKENGIIFRVVKFIEKRILRKADGFVVLTEKARAILFPESEETGLDKFKRPVEVIPCCVDLKRFENTDEASRKAVRKGFNIENRKVFTYVGSFGGWYQTDEMLDFFQIAREHDPQTFILILTQRDREGVIENLQKKGFSGDDFLVESVAPSDIPKFLNASDIAVSFVKKSYSKKASSPTKIAEYLASGLPVVSNCGIGDLDEIIETDKVGILIADFSREGFVRALKEIEVVKNANDVAGNCRRSARERFDIVKVGGEKYRRLYRRLLFAGDKSL